MKRLINILMATGVLITLIMVSYSDAYGREPTSGTISSRSAALYVHSKICMVCTAELLADLQQCWESLAPVAAAGDVNVDGSVDACEKAASDDARGNGIGGCCDECNSSSNRLRTSSIIRALCNW